MKYQIRTMVAALAFLLLAACGGGHPSSTPSNPTSSSTPPSTGSTNPAATISFTSASPAVIGLQGSGQTTTSTLVFTVTDANGATVADGTTVDFTINTLNGDEYIGPNDNTPTQALAQTSGGKGEVSIGLTSGTVAGVIIVRAVIDGTAITSESSKISIGGGVIDTAHFSLSSDKYNLPGMVIDNATATIQALMGDRFGNYNVLEGTPVKFYAEAGAIDTSNVTDKTGATTVNFRTQLPHPYDGTFTITTAEQNKIADLNSTYGLSIPTDGSVLQRREWVTIMATVPGEENFTDNNANGYYDAGDTFIAGSSPSSDDVGEPYIDQNSNGQWDIGETYIDTVSNGSYDGPNGVWDGPNCPDTGCQSGKTIWRSITLMFTGNGAYCAFSTNSTTTTSIARGATVHYQFMVGDKDLNYLVAGTKISITTTAGKLSGDTDYTVPDGVGGPTEINIYLNNNLASTASSTTATITAKVTGPTIASYTIVGCPQNKSQTFSVTLQ